VPDGPVVAGVGPTLTLRFAIGCGATGSVGNRLCTVPVTVPLIACRIWFWRHSTSPVAASTRVRQSPGGSTVSTRASATVR
jgi:hypothetical protein